MKGAAARSSESLEQRVADLEGELARLKAKVDGAKQTGEDWLDKIYGSFANSPIYDEAMHLGRMWRESFHLKSLSKSVRRRTGGRRN